MAEGAGEVQSLLTVYQQAISDTGSPPRAEVPPDYSGTYLLCE